MHNAQPAQQRQVSAAADESVCGHKQQQQWLNLDADAACAHCVLAVAPNCAVAAAASEVMRRWSQCGRYHDCRSAAQLSLFGAPPSEPFVAPSRSRNSRRIVGRSSLVESRQVSRGADTRRRAAAD